MQEILDTVIVDPFGPSTTCVLWLHGLGADGHDFVPVIDELTAHGTLKIRFVFPHAPVRPITINGGMSMRAWYDVREMDLATDEDQGGISDSDLHIRALIDQELERGIAPQDLVLAGFSQGGAMALHSGLRYPETLAGILALSCYLPLAGQLAREAHAANAKTPIFMGHGGMDPIIPLHQGQASCSQLRAADYAVEFKAYSPMAHMVCPEELQDIAAWLDRMVGPRG